MGRFLLAVLLVIIGADPAMSFRIVLMPALTPANEKPRGVFTGASWSWMSGLKVR